MKINSTRTGFLSGIFALLCLSMLTFSCTDDDVLADLFHDRGVNDAPFLDPGAYITAARFPSDELASFQGRFLGSIEYYLLDKPTQCEVQVYRGSNGNEPATLVYSESVTVEMDAESWNLHSLATPVELTGEDIWIAVRVVLADRAQTIGCDPGPADANGDWIVSDSDNIWQTFRNFTNQEVNINWNIRGHLSE